MAADDVFSFNMNSGDGGRKFCASVVEDVLQQRNGGFNDILALRRAEESVSRRQEAATWLRKMVGLIGSRDLPNNPSEEEFLLGLRNGMILCNVINKVQHGAVPKVVENPIDSVYLPDGAALSAYQYFENVRNFLVAIEKMGLPSFESSDLEKGGSCIKVVNCILALKSYNEWKQAGANGSWKFGNIMKLPAPGKCTLRVGKHSDPFMNTSRNISQMDSNVMSDQNIGGYLNGFPVNISLESTKLSSSNHSLGTLVRATLSDKRSEEVPILVESMLMKVMEEFECRLANQNEQIRDTLNNLVIFDDKKSLPGAKVSDFLSSVCGETMAEHEGVTKARKEEAIFSNLTRKEGYKSWMRKQFLLDQQQEDIKKLKNSLQCTKTCIRLMQETYYKEFHDLGRHFQDLAHAASDYHKVLEENRQLYNQVQDLKGSIRVYCRVRPFLPGQQNGISTVENFGNGTITISNPLKQEKGSQRAFTFNKVFGPFASQEEVFADTKPLIRSVLDGYNVCIFAYGQTGAGKTYTMTGPRQITMQTQGVNFRALTDLFYISEERKDSFVYSISVQMIEIYNEQVRDLLVSDNKRLEIRNSSQQNGFNVPEASLVPVTSTCEVIELMNIGQRNRAVGSTALNDRSSRSHSCLTVHVQGRDTISGTIFHGCLHLVDLAGSERVDKSEVTGDRLKEAQHINKSLSALGDVVAALAQKNSHIPYRNSKLTQLLQDSLGGQAKTLMFVHISPEADALGETISTLKFAERVSTVELGAARMNKESGEVRELREQIASLKAALARKSAKPDWHSSSTSPMQSGHSSRRPPMEDGDNFMFQSNSSGGKKKGKLHGQQERSADSTSSPHWPAGDEKEPGSGDWVDKVIVDMQGAGEDTPTPLRCWDHAADNSPVPDTFYRGCITDTRTVVYHDQFDPMNPKENHDSNILRRIDSMTTDDMDDELEVGTSDSSEADLLWHFNLPSSRQATTGSGAARMKKKTKSRLSMSKSLDIRNMNGAVHSRKLANGSGGQPLQKTPKTMPERKRSTGKAGANGSVK